MVTSEVATGRVLVIEDDAEIADVLRRFLRQEGHEVRTAADGVEVFRRLRADGDVPILILTARTELDDRVEGLDSGADDYLVKPFERQELLARIRALLRR